MSTENREIKLHCIFKIIKYLKMFGSLFLSGVNVSNSRLPDNTESEYAVLEMFRGKTSGRHDKDYKHKKQELRTNTMQGNHAVFVRIR